jgi:hypothetical protein
LHRATEQKAADSARTKRRVDVDLRNLPFEAGSRIKEHKPAQTDLAVRCARREDDVLPAEARRRRIGSIPLDLFASELWMVVMALLFEDELAQ